MRRGKCEIGTERHGREGVDRAGLLALSRARSMRQTDPTTALTFLAFFFFPVGDAASGSGTTNVVARSWMAYTGGGGGALSAALGNGHATHLQPRIRHGRDHVVRLLLHEVLHSRGGITQRKHHQRPRPKPGSGSLPSSAHEP